MRQEDNSDCGITAEGIDFIESHSSSDELVKRLIHAGPNAGTPLSGEPGMRESSDDLPVSADMPSAVRLALAN